MLKNPSHIRLKVIIVIGYNIIAVCHDILALPRLVLDCQACPRFPFPIILMQIA
jgi:hypothetical protein